MTRRTAKLVVHVLGTLVGVASVLLAGAAWRLAQGPVDLTAATPYIVAALDDQNFGYRFEIGSAELAWGDWQRAFDLRVTDVRVLRDDGELALVADELLLEMALPPLVRGELRPREITVVGPYLAAERARNGTWSIALVAAKEQIPRPGTAPPPALQGRQIIEAFLGARETPPFDWLERVRIRDADLWVEDRLLDLTWHGPGAELALERDGNGLQLAMDMALQAQEHLLDVELAALYRPDANTILLSSRLNDFALADLVLLAPMVPSLDGLDVTVDGELTLALDGALAITGGSFSLSADNGRIDMPRVFEAPFSLGPSRARGTIGHGFSGVEIEELELGLGLRRSSARVTIGGWTPEAMVEAQLDVEGLPVDDLGSYWPVKLVPRARAWLTDHLSGGMVPRAVITLGASIADLSSNRLPLENMVIDLDVVGGSIEYVTGLPPIEGVDAHVRISDDRLRIEASQGTLNGLVGSNGLVTMDGLNGRNGMVIEGDATGDVARALEVLSQERLNLGSMLALDPDTVAGTLDGHVSVVLPRLAGLKGSEVQFALAADLDGLALAAPLGGYRMDDGRGALVFEEGAAHFTGNLEINDVPFAVDYRQSFRRDDAVRRTVSLVASVSEEARTALGMPDPIDMEGPMDLTLDLVQTSAGAMTWTAVADLAPLSIDYPLLAIAKAPGEPGMARLRVIEDAGPVLRLETISLDVGDTRVAGSGALRSVDMGLMRIDLRELVFGRNILAGALSVREDGLFEIALAGGTADLEPLLEDLTASSGPTLPPFRLKGALDGVWLTEDDKVTDVAIDGTYQGDRWEALDVTGTLGEGTTMSLSIWRFSPEERRFSYIAGDVGDAVRTIGLFDNASGGTLDIRARIDDTDPERPSAGIIQASDFTLTQAPILARILSIASLTGMANTLTGEGLDFDTALAPFEKRGDLLTLTDARAYGPGIGITVFGTVDLATDELDLDGTIVPIYEINSALGQIPLIGDIFTGFEEGGGLFGFTYEVTGARDEPQIAVNPLSLLTPGILRRIFSGPSDDEVGAFQFEAPRSEGGR